MVDETTIPELLLRDHAVDVPLLHRPLLKVHQALGDNLTIIVERWPTGLFQDHLVQPGVLRQDLQIALGLALVVLPHRLEVGDHEPLSGIGVVIQERWAVHDHGELEIRGDLLDRLREVEGWLQLMYTGHASILDTLNEVARQRARAVDDEDRAGWDRIYRNGRVMFDRSAVCIDSAEESYLRMLAEARRQGLVPKNTFTLRGGTSDDGT